MLKRCLKLQELLGIFRHLLRKHEWLLLSSVFSCSGVSSKKESVAFITVQTKSFEITEQAAIAIALDDKRTRIYSESRSAIRAFAKGTVSKLAL